MKKRVKPPKLHEFILKKITASNQESFVLGDYEEDYNLIADKSGKKVADKWYRKEVLNSLIPFISNKINWGIVMFGNYLKIAFRNIKKHKGFSFINILGLSIGLMCTILILLWVNEQLSFDQFNKKAENIYVLNRDYYNGNGVRSLHLRNVAPAIAPKVRDEIPETEKIARIRHYGSVFGNGKKNFKEGRVYFAEQEIFDILDFNSLSGDLTNALKEPYSIIITEKIAEKYFGSVNSVGETLIMKTYGENVNFRITGVIESLPFTSHFQPEFLISFSSYESMFGKEVLERWSNNNFKTYLLLYPNTDLNLLQTKLDKIINDRFPENGIKSNRLILQNILDIHLDGDKSRIYITSTLAIFILLIACLNFMNLSTARSVTRSKEVSIRKSIGALRKELIKQFLGESVILTMISLTVSLLLILIVLPSFNNLFRSEISPSSIINLKFLLIAIGFGVFTGIITGFYPAIYLSRFNPISVLNKISSGKKRKFSIRTALVIFQFSLAIFLIICVGILQNQMEFISNKNLGYNKENILLINSNKYISEHITQVKTELLRNKNVKSVTIAKRVPSGYLDDDAGLQIYDKDKFSDVDFRVAYLDVDSDYLSTFGINVAAGRNFSKDIKSDYNEAFILNRIVVEKLGWISPDAAVGKSVKYGGVQGKIIGVVENFHFESLHEPLKPFVMRFKENGKNRIAIKIASEDTEATINFIKNKWMIYEPGFPFVYNFLDDVLQRRYILESILKQIFTLAVFFAIFVACLGLLGLSAFSIEQRIKEIGIRKVLGANSSQIIFILSKEFGKWILVSNIFAWPFAYIFMDELLNIFAFRISLSAETFLLAGTVTFFVAMFTVFTQAGKAAASNPVKSLRVES